MRAKVTRTLAVLCADLHLSHVAPVARSGEKDWYAAQARALRWLAKIAGKRLPIFCAGDIFDRWQCPPELINFAIAELPPQFYAVPGQHDLPYHDYGQIRRSAYWTLVEAGRIHNLRPFLHTEINEHLSVTGFPWGSSPEEYAARQIRPPDMPARFQLAVVHHYIWDALYKHPHPTPKEGRRAKLQKQLQHFDAAVFGDNHIGFVREVVRNGVCSLVNCGSFMRRHKGDKPPAVYVLDSSGRIEPYYYDVKEDIYDPRAGEAYVPPALNGEQIQNFLRGLKRGAEQPGAPNYREAVTHWINMHRPTQSVRALLLESIGDGS